MPRVMLERDGLKIEADLTLGDIKELLGVKSAASNGSHAIPFKEEPRSAPLFVESPEANYPRFLREISDRGREFIRILKEHPSGIDSNAFAAQLGFKDAKQIGGLSGGGLSKIANRNGVDLKKLYRTEITFSNGVRTLTFYPEEFILNEKPA